MRLNVFQHQMTLNIEMISCACGCGEQMEERNKWGYLRRFKHGHNGRGIPLSAEHKMAVSIKNRINSWRGGRHIYHGYFYLYKPDHPFADKVYVLEHRYVWEEHHK